MYALSREKPHIYSKRLPGQGLSQENQMQSKNRFSSNQAIRKLRLTERKSRRKTLQTPKNKINPQYGLQFCYVENIFMAWGKPQQTE
jgi:hypothetical protein